MYRHHDEPNFASFTAALKAGNSEACVAYYPGVKVPVVSHTEYEDYTAGETAKALPECPGPFVGYRPGHRAPSHVLSYRGSTWCGGQPRFPDELVLGYPQHVRSHDGVVTWDVPIDTNALIPDTFLRPRCSSVLS
jgi:hypothetical protein